MKTPFEVAQEQVANGSLQTPSVSTSQGSVDYFGYQLAVHQFNLRIMASGMTCRGIKFSQIKKYYGLKGRSAKDCLSQFQQLFADYKKKLDVKRMGVSAN